jgi:hypothetical protein
MERTGILPDAYFRVCRATEDGARFASFFLEVQRSDRSDRAWEQKLRRVSSYFASGDYARTFSARSLRVLFVYAREHGLVPERRVEKLAEMATQLGITLAWFSTLEEFISKEPGALLTTPLWREPGGKRLKALFEASA